MDSTRFDALTKALATPTSRRQAIRRIGGIIAGVSLAGLFPGLAFASNSACAHFCASVFGADTPAANQCTSDAAHGKSLCYTCGPAAPADHPPLCGHICCSSGQVCLSNGTCATPATYQYVCQCNLVNSSVTVVVSCQSGTCPSDLTAVCTQLCASSGGYTVGNGSCSPQTC